MYKYSESTTSAKWVSLLDEAHQLAKLSLPVIMTQLAQRVIGTTDVVMLSSYSPDALGASAIGLAVYYSVLFLCIGIPSAFAAELAQIIGRGKSDKRTLARVLRTGLLGAAIISIPAVILLQLTGLFLLLLGEPMELVALAGRYTATIGVSIPFVIGFDILRNYAVTLGRPALPLVVVVITIAVNAIGNFALIFGNIGAPELGLWGSALSTLFSNTFMFILMVLLIAKVPILRCPGFFAELFYIDSSILRKLFRIGLPTGLGFFFEVLFFTSGALILGYFGTAVLAAHQIVNTIIATIFLVPMGLGAGATIRLGMAVGAQDQAKARRVATVALSMGIAFSTVCALVMAVFPDRLVGLFIDTDASVNSIVFKNAITFLYFAAAFQVLDAVQVISNSLLRGLQDTFVPMMLAGGSYWLVGFPTSIGFTFVGGLGGVGVWIGYTLALFVAAITLWFRFIKRVKQI